MVDGPIGDPADHISRMFGGARNEEFMRRLEELEFEADIAAGRHGRDPHTSEIRMHGFDLDTRRRLRGEFRAAMQLDEIMPEMLEVADVDLAEFQGDTRPYAQARIAPTEAGEVTPMQLAYQLQSFQVDEAHEIGPDRYDLSGRVHRPSVLQQHADLLNQAGQAEPASRLVFDVETTGLGPSDEVWQVAGRFTDREGNVRDLNQLFGSERMDLGVFGYDDAGRPLNFEDYYRQTADPDAVFRRGEDAREGLREFLSAAEEADELVGHNVGFDVEHLSKHMRRTLDDANNPLREEDMRRVQQFEAKARRAYDTRILAAHRLGDIDIDPALRQQGTGRLAMENIMSRTSLLENVAEREGVDRVEALLQRGVHYADVDVVMEDELYRQLREVRTQHDSSVSQNALEYRTPMREWQQAVRQSGAVTPFTRMDDLGRTPMQELISQQRRFDAPASAADVTQEHIFRGAEFSKWLENITEGGRFRPGMIHDMPRLPPGMGVGRMSAPEAALSGLLGRASRPDETTPEAAGTARFQLHREARMYGQRDATGAARISALSPELLSSAERAGHISTRHGHALVGEDPGTTPMGRLSTIDFTTPSGRYRDIALTADLGEEDAQGLARFIREMEDEALPHFGIADRGHAAEIARTVEDYGHSHGVQLGVMGRDNEGDIRRAAEIMDDLGMGTDTGPHTARVPLGAADTSYAYADVGPTFIDTGEGVSEEHARQALGESREFRDRAGQAMEDETVRIQADEIAAGRGRVHPGYLRAREFMANNWRMTLGLGAATLGGALLFGGDDEEQELYEAPFQQQYYESGHHEDRIAQKRMRNLSYRVDSTPPKSARQLSRHNHTGQTQRLHRERTKHHSMDRGKKNEQLFL